MALEFRNAIFRNRSEMSFGTGMNLKLECFCGEHTFTEKVISDGGSRLRVAFGAERRACFPLQLASRS